MIKVIFRPVGLDASKNVTMGAQSSASFSLRLCSCNPELAGFMLAWLGLPWLAIYCSLALGCLWGQAVQAAPCSTESPWLCLS